MIKEILKNTKMMVCSLICGFLISFSVCEGWFLTHNGTIGGSAVELLFNLFCVCLATMPISLVIGMLFLLLDKNDAKETKIENIKLRKLMIIWLAIFVLWIPNLLAYFPGIMAYDVIGQLEEVIYKQFSTHHPLAHTLFLGVCYKLGGPKYGRRMGILLYSIIQMLIMSGVFSYAICYLERIGVKKWFRILVFLFYAIMPMNSLMALTTTKDSLFGAFVLLGTLLYYDKFFDKEKCSSLWTAFFIVAAMVMLLFRNNAVYAWIVLIPFAIMSNKGKMKKILFVMTAALVLSLCVNGMLKFVTKATPGGRIEFLSVPLQQMARVGVLHQDELSDKELNYLSTYLGERYCELYNEHISDKVKRYCNSSEIVENPVDFFRCWAYFGMRHPIEYVDAFLLNIQGLYDINDKSHSVIYGSNASTGTGYMCTATWTLDEPSYNVYTITYLPKLRKMYGWLINENGYQKIPVVSILFSLALYSYVVIFFLMRCIYKKNWKMWVPGVFLLLYLMTLFLGPTAIMRYVYPLMVCSPVLLAIMIKGDCHVKEKNN